MLTPKQHEKIARKTAAAIIHALDSFPELLAQTDIETAALIVADIIKTQLKLPVQEEDPGLALAEVIRQATELTREEMGGPR